MNGTKYYQTKRSKSGRERQTLLVTSYMWNLKKKMIQRNLFTNRRLRHRKQTYGYQRGRGRDKVGVWDSQIYII